MPEIKMLVPTEELVAKLTAEAQEVGAAMRRIVDACMSEHGRVHPDALRADLEKADAWLRAVGA